MKTLKERLIEACQGICHWCDKPVMIHRIKGGQPTPHNHATIDHVYPKGDARRDDSHQTTGIVKSVIACRACNNERGNLPYDVYLVLKRPEWRGILDAGSA